MSVEPGFTTSAGADGSVRTWLALELATAALVANAGSANWGWLELPSLDLPSGAGVAGGVDGALALPIGDVNRPADVASGRAAGNLRDESARPAFAAAGAEVEGAGDAGAGDTGATGAANMAGSDFARTFIADGNFEGLTGFGLAEGDGPTGLTCADATGCGATDATFVAAGSSKSQLSSTESIRDDPLGADCPDCDAAGVSGPGLLELLALEPGVPKA